MSVSHVFPNHLRHPEMTIGLKRCTVPLLRIPQISTKITPKLLKSTLYIYIYLFIQDRSIYSPAVLKNLCCQTPGSRPELPANFHLGELFIQTLCTLLRDEVKLTPEKLDKLMYEGTRPDESSPKAAAEVPTKVPCMATSKICSPLILGSSC